MAVVVGAVHGVWVQRSKVLDGDNFERICNIIETAANRKGVSLKFMFARPHVHEESQNVSYGFQDSHEAHKTDVGTRFFVAEIAIQALGEKETESDQKNCSWAAAGPLGVFSRTSLFDICP